jgi:segregation and condensation protein B
MNNEELLKLEALLFAYGRLVPEEELAKALSISQPKIKELLSALKQKHATNDSSLNLIQQDNRWKLTVKDNYLAIVKSIVTKTELDRQTIETLAVIAFKYPVLQSEVINIRNASAYEHIKNLVEAGYVVKEKSGRSFKLKLTQKFFDYFDLPEEKLKEFFSDFRQIEKEIIAQEEKAESFHKLIEEQKKILKAKEENKQLSGEPNPEPEPNPFPTPEPGSTPETITEEDIKELKNLEKEMKKK